MNGDLLMRAEDYDFIEKEISQLENDPAVQEMRTFYQHGKVSTYVHARRVMRKSYAICKFFRAKVDYHDLLYAAFLHDFYLYDWHHTGDGSHRLHGFRHPKRAAENAVARFGVSPTVSKAIRTHMWPLTLAHIPTSRIGWIVCIADKIVSIQEVISRK